MKSFWLLLLAFVLPLQMSWAATHFCDDELAAPVLSAAGPGQAQHKHDQAAESAKKSDATKTAQPVDCCAAAHGCHGLHHLMGHAEASRPAVFSIRVVAARDAPSTGGVVATRVERPKWSAA